MRISNIKISNFKSIEHAELNECDNSIVIAGSNGCGKSTIFDAIRFIKSAYGQYNDNELQQFWNESKKQGKNKDGKGRKNKKNKQKNKDTH